MSYTKTPNLGLFKPTDQDDFDQWGIHLNADMDILDTTWRNLATTTVPTIAALRALQLPASPAVLVQGYYNPNDGGGGLYVLSATPATDNGGTIIISGAGTYYLLSDEPYSVRHFGAVGNGTVDDTAAIQAAMDAGAARGGAKIFFPSGNYKISSTLRIGNGSASAVSTKSGVVLTGVPAVAAIFWPGYSVPSATRITWAGGAAYMIDILGPLMGWGVQNVELIGNSVATIGLHVMSAKYGDCRNLVITGCIQEGIGSDTVPMIGSNTNTDSMFNSYKNIYIGLPAVAGAKGVVLTGATGVLTSDTDMNSFDNLFIAMPATGVTYGIYLQNCDANQFQNVLLTGGNASAVGVLFDYTANSANAFPLGNGFYGIDTNGNALGLNQWVNIGTPSISARPNFVRGLKFGDGTTNPSLPNLLPDLPVVVPPVIYLRSQTASITGTVLIDPYGDGVYRVSLYLGIQSTGNNVTVAASIGWNDGVARTYTTPAINMSTGANNPQSTTLTVINLANLGLTYSTTVSGAIGAGTYQLAIVAERVS